ncbi:MAG TPA: hypothetical protein PKM27_16935 [Saprospiraceae bacterium]|nr:hypothetical protein [Saprospiraceae bacterium]
MKIHLPSLPRVEYPPGFKEIWQKYRERAEQMPPHIFTGQPPAGPLRPENSGIPEPEPETTPTITDLERLRRTQAIINKGIEDRIMQAEVDQDSLSPPLPCIDDWQDMERYFTSATIPPEPFRIGCVTVNDPIEAIRYHLSGLKAAPPESLVAKADVYHLRVIKAALEALEPPP